MVKKGMAAKKAIVERTSQLRVRAKIVASRPSTITNRAWIYAASPAERLAKWEEGSAGKRCVFRHNDAIDEAWLTIRRAVEAGRLPLAKVSTGLTSPRHADTHVICVYSRDWRDDAALTAACEYQFLSDVSLRGAFRRRNIQAGTPERCTRCPSPIRRRRGNGLAKLGQSLRLCRFLLWPPRC